MKGTTTTATTTTGGKEARHFRPEQYRLLPRCLLEGALMTLYIVLAVVAEVEVRLWAPSYTIPFYEAAVQIFILYSFFQYGVGYVNPFTCFAVAAVSFTRPLRSSSRADEEAPAREQHTLHRVNTFEAVWLAVAELVGMGVATFLCWALYSGSEYGFEALDYDEHYTPWHRGVMVALVGSLTIIPKLMSASKRHSIASNVATVVAAAYVIAGFVGHRNVLLWWVQALLSSLGGHGWASDVSRDAWVVTIGGLGAAALAFAVVSFLPRRRARFSSSVSH
jgi:hypothetical protein